MGGQSFKCPQCEKWYTLKGSLRIHMKENHDVPKFFEIEGTGHHTYIVPTKEKQS